MNGVGEDIVVPLGHTYVVKQATWYSNPTLGAARGFLRDVNSGATVFSCATQALTPAWFGFYGHLVFDEGRIFRWEVSATGTDGADVYVGGFDLTSPP